MRRLTAGLGVLGLALAAWTTPARAYDPKDTFMQGSIVISPEVSYGEQFNLEGKSGFSGIKFLNAGLRFGWLPYAPLVTDGPLHGSLELGLEPLYQQYVEPDYVYFAGLGVTARYHFLSLGRLVPFADAAAFAGATNLKRTEEIRSDFSFLLWLGVGASYFVSDRTALYGAYRYQHVSNGNTSRPNRGFESHTGVVGMSFFFE